MNLDKLKQYFMSLYKSSPAGQINTATAAGAQAAGVPSGATPLTDALSRGAQTITGDIRDALPAMPSSVSSGINSTNSFLDSLHDKLFQYFGRTGQAGGR